MKKKKNLKTTAAGIIAGVMSGCTFLPGCNVISSVYGPPPSETYDPSQNEPEDVYGPPVTEEEISEDDYNAEVNENPAVYGPPPDYSAPPAETDE